MPNNFQQHQFLVFENTQPILSFNSIDVFSTGSSLPWTYYTNTLKVDDEGNKNSGYSKIMMTAESKDVIYNNTKVDAGVAVTKLRTFVNGSEAIISGDGPGGQVSAKQYLECGWPLTKDENNEYILPKYGDFTFCKDYKPSFEDSSEITLNLQIGFGLSTTIYNYQDAEVSIGIHNLSVEPQFFISSQPNIGIEGISYDETSKKWKRMIGVNEDTSFKQLEYDGTTATLTDNIYEGSTEEASYSPYKYLYVKVESGESVRMDMHSSDKELQIAPTRNGTSLVGATLGDVVAKTNASPTGGDFGVSITANTFYDVVNDGTNTARSIFISTPNKSTEANYTKDVTNQDIGKDLGMSFYVFKIGATSDYNQFSYVGSKTLSQTISITPVPTKENTASLNIFKRSLNLNLTLLPSKSNVFIRDDFTSAVHNFYDHEKATVADFTGTKDLSDQSNLRQRIVITAEEAINYAYNYNDSSAPSFISQLKNQGKSASEVYRYYQKAILTDVENKFYDYKASFETDDNKTVRMAIFAALDLSQSIRENFDPTFVGGLGGDKYTNEVTHDLSGPVDLSQIYFNNSLPALRKAIANNITSKGFTPTLNEIQTRCATELGDVLNMFKAKRDNFFGIDGGNDLYDQSAIPHTDKYLYTRQRIGEIVDLSEGDYNALNADVTAYRRRTVLGHESSLFTILFGFHEYKNSVLDPTNPIGTWYEAASDLSSTPAYKIQSVMQRRYLQGTSKATISASAATDLSGSTDNRPSTIYDQIKEYRLKKNPVNGSSATEYLTKMLKIKDTNATPDIYYYGSDQIYDAYNVPELKKLPTKDDIKKLLYEGGLAKQIIEASASTDTKLINDNALTNGVFSVSNPVLNTGSTNGDNIDTSPAIIHKLNGYSSADQSAVFYTHYRFTATGAEANYFNADDNSGIGVSLGPYGDLSGCTTSFYRDDLETNTMRTKWVYTKLNGMVNGFGSADRAHASFSTGEANSVETYKLDNTQTPWFNTTSGGYHADSRHPEGTDFSGVIKFPRVIDAKYYDIFAVGANGQEVEIKESVVDPEEMYEKSYYDSTGALQTVDLSNLDFFTDTEIAAGTPEYNKRVQLLRAGSAIDDTVSITSAQTGAAATIKQLNFKYKLTDVGAFQFYRLGSTVRIFANGSDLDADRADLNPIPTIKFRLKGATKSVASDKMYQLHVWPSDVASKLNVAQNVIRPWAKGIAYGITASPNPANNNVLKGTGYNVTHTDTSGVWVNRYNDAYIPLDVSGILEEGENLMFELTEDEVAYSSTDISNIEGATTYATYFPTATTAYFPIDDAYKFKVVYEEVGSDGTYSGNWKEYNGSKFTYECHNKTTMPASFTFSRSNNSGIGLLNSNASSGVDGKEGKNASSSNIKGKPRFAVKLPAQIGAGLAITEFDNEDGHQNNNAFKTAGRKVKLKLKTVSNKINSAGTNIETMTQTITVGAFVTSAPYDPNITVQQVKYDKTTTKIDWLTNDSVSYTPGTISYDTEYRHAKGTTDDASNNNYQVGFSSKTINRLPGVALNDSNVFFPATEEVVVSGKTYIKAKKFTSSLDRTYIKKETKDIHNLTRALNIIDSDNQFKSSRDMSGMDVSCNEYNYGPTMPIARINIDPNQYLKLNAKDPIAEIVPVFRRHSDYEAYTRSTDKEGFIVDKDEAVAVNSAQDAAGIVPLYIPANHRYAVKINSTEILLYRKDPEEFTWYQKEGHATMNTAANNRRETVPEMVNVQVKFVTPKGDLCTKTFMFFVRVTNQRGLKFVDPDTGKPTKSFSFDVMNGDREVDITKIFNAKMGQAYDDDGIYYSESENMEGNTLTKVGNAWEISKVDDNIIYNVVGFVDASGRAYIHQEQFSATGNNFEIITDLSNGIDLSNTYNWNGNEGAYTAEQTELSLQKTFTDIGAANQTTVDMMSKKFTAVNGINSKISLYHENYNTNNQVSEGLISANGTPVYSTNNWFNSYVRDKHQFFVMAQYRSSPTVAIDDMSGVERALALVTINVKSQNSGFYLQGAGDYDPNLVKYYDLNETLGTVEEGKTEAQNNPEIKISTFTDKIKHPNSGSKTIEYKIASLDSDLIVCPPTLGDDLNNTGDEQVNLFKNLVIKLKDINANKTTETKGKASTSLSEYNHYNYERKSLYKIGISAEISRFEEVVATKAGPTYICDLHRNANSQDVINGAVSGSTSKHASWLISTKKPDGSTLLWAGTSSSSVDVSGKSYYFKNDKGYYEGPLSLVPSKLDQLFEKKNIHEVEVSTAYARFDNGTDADVEKRFIPLYKAADFRDDHVNPPIAEHNGVFEFFIRVGDTFDLAKQSPQPYKLKPDYDYKTADPAQQILIDPMDITAKVQEINSEQEICYVFADYEELEANEGFDFNKTSKKPRQSVDFSNVIAANSTQNDITQVKRKPHPWASNMQPDVANRKGTGTFVDSTKAGNVFNTSNQFYASSKDTYGTFPSDLSNVSGVFLDMFIEYPPEYADMSGWDHVVTGDIPFGEKVDVSMNLPIGKRKVVSGVNTLVYDNNTSFRTYRLKDIKRHEQHEGVYDLSGKYYTKGVLSTRSGFTPTIGKTYKFIVAGVTNKLATPNDQSYNANMIDFDGYFFDRKEKLPLAGAPNWMDRETCYSYQKYVYDPSGAQIRTVAQAVQLLGNLPAGGDAPLFTTFGSNAAVDQALRATNGICDNSSTGAFVRPESSGTNNYAYTYDGAKESPRVQYIPGALLVCRTKFKVTFAAATQSASSGSSASSTSGINEVKIYNALAVSSNVITWGSDTPATPNTGQGATVTFTHSSVNSGRPTTATFNPSTGKWTHN